MELSDRDLARLSEFVCERYGINLEAKRALIEARMSFYLEQKGYSSFRSYIDDVLLASSEEECQRMINRISTNYSYFFREMDCLTHLVSRALPEFKAAGRSRLSIWSAACAGGQEAYSFAMVLKREAELHGYPASIAIRGTDINTEVLAQAQKGEYELRELSNIPEKYRAYVRSKDDKSFQLCDCIKSLVTWERENLLCGGAKQAQYDVILCRNAMIYFKADTRKRITKSLYGCLSNGGYLYTGVTEAVDLERKLFKYIAPSIYKKEV